MDEKNYNESDFCRRLKDYFPANNIKRMPSEILSKDGINKPLIPGEMCAEVLDFEKVMDSLTIKERGIIKLAAEGFNYNEIAKKRNMKFIDVEKVIRKACSLFCGREIPKERSRLKVIRISLGVSQDEVAAKLKPKKDAYSKFERGIINLDDEESCDKIMDYLISCIKEPHDFNMIQGKEDEMEVWERVIPTPLAIDMEQIIKIMPEVENSKIKYLFYHICKYYKEKSGFESRYGQLLNAVTGIDIVYNLKGMNIRKIREYFKNNGKDLNYGFLIDEIGGFAKSEKIYLNENFYKTRKDFLSIRKINEDFIEMLDFMYSILVNGSYKENDIMNEIFWGTSKINQEDIKKVNTAIDNFLNHITSYQS